MKLAVNILNVKGHCSTVGQMISVLFNCAYLMMMIHTGSSNLDPNRKVLLTQQMLLVCLFFFWFMST